MSSTSQPSNRGEEDRLPNLIVIGTMKGGTSSLYRYLRNHPSISMSTTKETDYFLGNDPSHDMAWYLEQFEPGHRVRGEVSPNYTKREVFPGIPERIHAVVPDARLVYVVRDPIERTVSHFLHNVHAGRFDLGDFERVLTPGGGPEHLLATGLYHHQLSAYLPLWSPDDILVVASEDLRDDRRNTLRRVFGFLGVDETFDSEVFDKMLHVSARKFGDEPFERPTVRGELRDVLAEYFAADVAALRSLTGASFPRWSL